MKDYYQILGVSQTASTAQIKAAYRKLVQQYHPDVNPNPEAHGLIQEVNEAYDVLSDNYKRTAYDGLRSGTFVTINVEPQPRHRDPAYRRRTTRPFVKEDSSQVVFMKKVLPVVVLLSWIGLFTCALLMVDLLWPQKITATEIYSYRNERVGRATVNYLITKEGRYFKISSADWVYMSTGQRIDVVESGLLSILITLRLPKPNYSVTNLGTIYRNFIFVPIILVIAVTLSFLVKGSVEFRFNLGMVMVFVLIFTWVLMFK
jgi:hypothetical protein